MTQPKLGGHTYPGFLEPRPIRWLWKKIWCPRGWHLWDEVSNSDGDHYLHCDACEATFVGQHGKGPLLQHHN